MAYEFVGHVPIPHYDAYATHQFLWAMVTQMKHQPGAQPFRFATLGDGERSTAVLLRSKDALGLRGEERVEYKFQPGQAVKFSASIAVTLVVDRGDGKRKNIRVPDDEIETYLEQKFTRAGVLIEDLQYSETKKLKINNRKGSYWVPFVEVVVCGVVADPNLLEVAFEDGIGAKRSLGLGMLILMGSSS